MAYTTTQGTITPAGVVNYDPNTGQKLSTGQAVQVAQGGNTYGATTPVGGTQVPTTPAPTTTPTTTGNTPSTSGVASLYGSPIANEDSTSLYYTDRPAYEASKGLSIEGEKASLAGELQRQIDASNALYAQKLREAKIVGEARLGATRSGELSRGTVGGNVATAATDVTTNVNTGEYNQIEQERAMAEANVRSTIEKLAQDRYDKKSLAMSGNVKDYVEYVKGKKEDDRKNAEDVANALIANGVDPSVLTKEQIKNAGTSLTEIKNAYAVKQYAAKKADDEAKKKITDADAVRAAEQADRIALEKEKATIEANKPVNLSEGQAMYRTNPTTGKVERVAYNPKTYAPEKTPGTESVIPLTEEGKTQKLNQLTNIKNLVAKVESLADRSGSDTAWEKLKQGTIGATGYTNLVAQTNALRVQAMTVLADPNNKKFFGPAMSNADVQLMMAGGNPMNPQLQTPAELKASLTNLLTAVNEIENNIKTGKVTQIAETPADTAGSQTMILNGVTYKVGADGQYYPAQ